MAQIEQERIFSMTRWKAALVSIAVAAGGSAHAVTLDFNGLPTSPGGGISAGTTVTEDGYVLTDLQLYIGLVAFGDGWQSGRGGSNGSTVLGLASRSGASGSMLPMARLQAVTSAPFALHSIDLGEIFKASDFAAAAVARTYRFDGVLAGGGTVTASFVVDLANDGPGGAADFQTLVFGSGWNGLTAVTMSASTPSNIYGTWTYFDNIVVDASALAVPEPASISLAGLALLALGAGRVKRRQS